jgi:hypothetical protein
LQAAAAVVAMAATVLVELAAVAVADCVVLQMV